MNEAGKNIIQHLFGQSALTDVSIKDIEAIASRYPYFSVAQFLLAKKLNDDNSIESKEQLHKTALHFTNPYWLNYLLHEEEIFSNEENISSPSLSNFIEDAQEPILPIDEQVEEVEPITQEEVAPEINELILEKEEADEIISAIEIHETDLAEPADEIIPAVEIPETEEIIEEEEEYLPTAEEKENAEADPQRIKLSNIIEQHLADFKKPVTDSDELPVKSNPYHTIDYFASQGIRADGQDKLGSRVKKFTDWLKQMKVANAQQPADLGTDLETEKLIETIAATSNETKDIVTEAMAEVLIKQSKIEKAISLYKKLGLLNPDKSAYFAAKIEALNNK